MRKTAVIFFVVILSNVCSLFQTKAAPYPTGIMFPLVKEGEVSYEGEIIAQIQRIDQNLYFSTRRGKVYCIDGQNRQVLWRFDTPVTLSSPTYLGVNHIYVYDAEGTLYCLEKQGKLLWQKKTSERITSDVVENRGRIFFGTEKSLLYCLNPESGDEVWRFHADRAIQSNLVIWRDMVLFVCDDHSIYFVDRKGKLSGVHDIGSSIGQTLTVDKNSLYFGTEDGYLQCMNLKKRKIRWRIRSGGAPYVPPVVDENRIYFLCWNSVLYCLNKKTGTILWWGMVPSRSYFRVEVVEDKVVVTSFSSELVGFDKKTGEEAGTYNASQEIVSNPIWIKPFLLVNFYDWEGETGKLVILKKEVNVVLSPSKKTPQKRNEEIVFSARSTGFHLPNFEFFLDRYAKFRLYPDLLFFVPDGERQVVQESSEDSTWSWFPEQEGYYKVGVLVTDEKERAQTEIPYCIQKEKVTVIVTASLESPQEVSKEIVFKAVASGFEVPNFEFHLSRLIWLNVLSDFVILFPVEEKAVQESSELSTWTWIPERAGFYRIRAVAQGDQEKAEAEMLFRIKKKKKNE